jgi:hypothetical protein
VSEIRYYTIVEEAAFSGNVAADYSDCALTLTLQEERCKNTSFENFSRYFGHIYSKNVKFKGGKMFKHLSSASGQLALHGTIFSGGHSWGEGRPYRILNLPLYWTTTTAVSLPV